MSIIQCSKSYFTHALTKYSDFSNFLSFTFELNIERILFSTGKKKKKIKTFHLDKIKILI